MSWDLDSHTTTNNLELGITEIDVKNILEMFYERAFDDALICHFFMGRDKKALIEKQLSFTVGLLGGPKNYTGKSLPAAHFPLKIRKPHFMRRRVLMHECMLACGLTEIQAIHWLEKEDNLRPAILSGAIATKQKD